MKTKNMLISSLMLLFLTQTTASCVHKANVFDSDAPKVTQVRPLKGFERIEIYGSPTVYYTQADTFSVEVQCPENMLDEIVTEVSGKSLSIRNRGKLGIINVSIAGHNDIVVNVTSPDLIGIHLSGSGDFISRKRVDTDNMSIVLRGSGDVKFADIICDRCETELTGSGDIDVDRLEAQTSSISLVGSGDLDVRQWNVDDTRIALKGSGDIDVHFEEGCRKVNCQLTGSGDITLSGKIGQFGCQKRGSGDIHTDKLMIEK